MGVIFGALLLVLPAAGAAVELMNYLVTTVLSPRGLAKMDFSKSVPARLRHDGCHSDASD